MNRTHVLTDRFKDHNEGLVHCVEVLGSQATVLIDDCIDSVRGHNCVHHDADDIENAQKLEWRVYVVAERSFVPEPAKLSSATTDRYVILAQPAHLADHLNSVVCVGVYDDPETANREGIKRYGSDLKRDYRIVRAGVGILR